MNHRHEALWLLKKRELYILCTLVLSNPFCLTFGSRLILIQNELWVPNFMMQIVNFFVLLCATILVIHHFFLVKNGSPLMCFHPILKSLYIYIYKQWLTNVQICNPNYSWTFQTQVTQKDFGCIFFCYK
jgi:hypothetical protein